MIEESTSDKTIDIKPAKTIQDFEKELGEQSAKMGQLYHQTKCLQYELDQLTQSFNAKLIEYKKVKDDEAKHVQ